MCGPATALGVAQGVSQGMGAIGDYMTGSAQTQATNQSRINAYRDQLSLQKSKYIKGLEGYRAEKQGYEAGLAESELALSKGFTQLDKRAAERIAESRFTGQDRQLKLMQAEGKIAAGMQAGRGKDRALALTRGTFGRDEALEESNLLRARFSDIAAGEGMVDQATSYRRSLFNKLSLAPSFGPTPTAPVLQSGPSALSLISGLGQAAIGGLSMGAQAEKGKWFDS